MTVMLSHALIPTWIHAINSMSAIASVASNAVLVPLPAKANTQNVAVIGFYDRGNLGDEMYKVAVRALFESHKEWRVTFHCTDDLDVLPPGTDLVICGGGDIIHPYFMDKVVRLTDTFTGPVYALSVGVPFDAHAHYLSMFDHVWARSRHDYALACACLGCKNVTYLPDLGFSLAHSDSSHTADSTDSANVIGARTESSPGPVLNLGLCLAQPAFFGNPSSPDLVNSICDLLATVGAQVYSRDSSRLRVHLLSFNTRGSSASECDVLVNEQVAVQMASRFPDVEVINASRVGTNPDDDVRDMLKACAAMDLTVCMRYHSIVFSILTDTAFVAMYTSTKVGKLLDDLDLTSLGYRMPDALADGKPTSIDVPFLASRIDEALQAVLSPLSQLSHLSQQWECCSVVDLVARCKRKHIRCHRAPTRFLTLAETVSRVREFIGTTPGPPSSIERARLITFCISGSLNSKYTWGLHDNMHRAGFDLEEAIRWIFEDLQKTVRSEEVYFSPIQYDVKARSTKYVMDHIRQDDSDGFHRCGWSYVVGGLMQLSHDRPNASFDRVLMVDAYVDRSFHWGCHTMSQIGLLPYTEPWIGFVHHTFDVSHSQYNCKRLFDNPMFLASLVVCTGLITFSEHLSSMLRVALSERTDGKAVEVHTMTHPIDTVDESMMFTFDRFLHNVERKVVQIGAWLRNPFAIYELGLSRTYRNPLGIRKAALRWKDMNDAFKPKGWFETLESMRFGADVRAADGIMCRDSCGDAVNKYWTGAVQSLRTQDASVDIIESLTNEEYDILLSRNIVFLQLLDCSAVNTVIECVIRNTPLVVNRHAAIVEYLGDEYPGFYDNLQEASDILGDEKRLRSMHAHLSGLDKARFSLDAFIADFIRVSQLVTRC